MSIRVLTRPCWSGGRSEWIERLWMERVRIERVRIECVRIERAWIDRVQIEPNRKVAENMRRHNWSLRALGWWPVRATLESCALGS
ncbi:hypothetical protein [Streptomyces sp. NPDC051738]|uniref:hypothetical protein n=1 Tax=Streptomyces sp. NPDC051738 TaxID=3365672 RepID=UPI0037D25CB0